MPPTSFPPLLTTYAVLSPLQTIELSQIYLIVVWSSFVLLVWDWAVHLPSSELPLVWHGSGAGSSQGRRSSSSKEQQRRGSGSDGHSEKKVLGLSRKGRGLDATRGVGDEWWTPSYTMTKVVFLASRYMAVVQGLVLVILFSAGNYSANACQGLRGLPFGFSVVSLLNHAVMTFRVYGMMGRSKKILIGLFVLALIDFGLQLYGDTLLQPVFLDLGIADAHTCFYLPSSNVFSLVFISPAVFHHIVLGLTLFASWRHAESERLVGASVMTLLRRDQIFYVLTICLVNAINVIMVFQNNSAAYKLINYFPAMVLTQIFLGRIFFSLRSFSYIPPPSLPFSSAPLSPPLFGSASGAGAGGESGTISASNPFATSQPMSKSDSKSMQSSSSGFPLKIDVPRSQADARTGSGTGATTTMSRDSGEGEGAASISGATLIPPHPYSSSSSPFGPGSVTHDDDRARTRTGYGV